MPPQVPFMEFLGGIGIAVIVLYGGLRLSWAAATSGHLLLLSGGVDPPL